MRPAWLVLADGSIFEGRSVGAEGQAVGEIVFQTGLTGYQEVITDPSYAGQIVTFTYPHIGNVGVNPEDMESAKLFLHGLIMCDYCLQPSSWRSRQPLHRYLKQQGIVAIEGVDTRAVTRRIRDHGAMPAVISSHARDPRSLISVAKAAAGMEGQELVSDVTCLRPYTWNAGSWEKSEGEISSEQNYKRPCVVVVDFGVKHNILRCLVDCGARVEVVPASTSAAEIMAFAPNGVLLSNGPGDPAAVEYAIETIRALLGKVPMFGICLGHQLLSLALGARTYKLSFGHHGANQPVQDLRTGRIEITSQNHGFAVDPKTLPANAQVTHKNLSDDTVEGFVVSSQNIFAVQYHPEASPGPHDAFGLFEDFLTACRGNQNA